MARKLNARQKRFVDEYLVDLNATQAAIRAGYSPKTAGQIGFKLLKKAEIAEAIAVAMEARSERTEITQDWVLERLVENIERSMQHEPVLDYEGKPTGEYRYEGNVVNRALELVGKHFAMWTDRVEHGGEIAGVVVIPAGESADDWAERAEQQQRRIQVSSGNGRGSS